MQTLGLTPSEAINIFYHKVALEKGLPFEVKVPNAVTLKAMDDANKRKKLTKCKNVDDMFKQLEQ